MPKAKKTKKKSTAKKKVVKKKTKKTTVKRKAKKVKVKKVAAIPAGYNNITPYLIVNRGSKAIDFYKKVFSAKEVMRMEQPDGKIGHAELKFGDTKIMLADEHPEMNAHAPGKFGGSPVGIHLYTKNVDKVADLAVAAGAKLVRPVEDQFYGDRSATLEDPYGHTWHISTHIEDVSKAQMKKRAAELFGKK